MQRSSTFRMAIAAMLAAMLHSTAFAQSALNASGAWVDPFSSGDGFNVLETRIPDGAGGPGTKVIVIFFYGYDVAGNPSWLSSDPEPGPFVQGQKLIFDMYSGGRPGDFQVPASPDNLVPWGTLEVTLQNCNEAEFVLSGADGFKQFEAVPLAPTDGVDCSEVWDAKLELDFASLLNYAGQDVPDYINARPGPRKDTAVGNPITDAGATLGRVLFYDRNLSVDNTVSCASCHQQEHAFSDLAAQSDGVDGMTVRHSMRLVNNRYSEDDRVRWDKTAPSLEAQTTMPVRDAGEMGFSGVDGNPGFEDLVAKLETVDYYAALFTLAFGSPEITEERIQSALAQFVRSIQSFDTKYDQGRAQVADDRDDFPNFTAMENAGKQLFMRNFGVETDTVEIDGDTFRVSRRTGGGLNCAACHRPPEFDIVPDSDNNGFTELEGQAAKDLTVTRSPSLRELVGPDGELNGGLFHAGNVLSLADMIEHYNFIAPDPQNNNLDRRLTPGGLPQFLDMTPLETAQLEAFLRTLAGNAVYSDERWSNPFRE